jgi:putative peptide zinc metalloprotease protein
MHWAQLTDDITDRVLVAHNIIVLIVAYPFIKILHELGHAYAVKRWGGEVHELGLMLLVFVPVPYVDASAASAFPNKWQRVLVGSAGIIVEVILASVALIVWTDVAEGLLRAIAFDIMVIGGVSTLIFNGNPLLRFDGYYVLSDFLEIPNLADRGRRYVGYLLMRYAFGVEDATSPATARGEAVWLFCFAIASFTYRLFVVSVIVFLIATKFFIIGIILAIWAAIMMLGVPLAKSVWFLFKNPILNQKRNRAITICGGALVAVVALLLLLPLPYRTTAEGIVWSPGEPGVYALSDGTVVRLLAKPNAIVSRGDALLELQDPLLGAEVRVLEAVVRELDLRRSAVAVSDPFQKQLFEEQLTRAKGDLALRRKQMADLVVRSPGNGRFIVKRPDDLVGKFFHKGELVGYVAVFGHPTALVIVPEESADLVQSRTKAIEVQFTTALGHDHVARVSHSVPSITNVLPSLALSTAGGGEITLDPRDPKSMKAITNVLHLELEFDVPTPVLRIGERVYVRFDHGYEPLATRLYLGFRQLFLRRFNV